MPEPRPLAGRLSSSPIQLALALSALFLTGGLQLDPGAATARSRPFVPRLRNGEAETSPRKSRGRPKLLDIASAEIADLDGSGDASAGDEVTVRLRRPLAPGRRVRLEDLALASDDESWGDDALVTVVSSDDYDEVHVVLGSDPALRLYGTYVPGTLGTTVARILAQAEAVPILVRTSDRTAFVGDRYPDSPLLRPRYGQLHAHTAVSDGALQPADAFERARSHGLDFFAVTDHLEQITARSGVWERERAQADQADAPGSFVALCGYEWGGSPNSRGWINHVNVVGSDQPLQTLSTLSLGKFYRGLLALPGDVVVGQFNHPGMEMAVIGTDNWNAFEYRGDADLRMKLIMVATRSPRGEDNREGRGMIPALDRGWHLGPKAEEDNHRANWAATRMRTGLWVPQLTRSDVLSGLQRMATFYTDDPDASLKVRIDGQWLMGSTVYGDGRHLLEVEVDHRTRSARVQRVEIIGRGGVVVAANAGGPTPLRTAFELAPDADGYFFARVLLEDADTRLISAPVFVDR